MSQEKEGLAHRAHKSWLDIIKGYSCSQLFFAWVYKLREPAEICQTMAKPELLLRRHGKLAKELMRIKNDLMGSSKKEILLMPPLPVRQREDYKRTCGTTDENGH